jgi:hypothetical protein
MKRKPKGAKKRPETIQVWTYGKAQAALPYFASIVRSLREHGLEVLARRREVENLNARPGRPNRSTLIALQEAERQARVGEDCFEDALEELQALDIYSLDPLAGTALVPFVHNDQLAWYIFDLFDARPLSFWRFQSDPDDTRRPVTSMQRGTAQETFSA